MDESPGSLSQDNVACNVDWSQCKICSQTKLCASALQRSWNALETLKAAMEMTLERATQDGGFKISAVDVVED